MLCRCKVRVAQSIALGKLAALRRKAASGDGGRGPTPQEPRGRCLGCSERRGTLVADAGVRGAGAGPGQGGVGGVTLQSSRLAPSSGAGTHLHQGPWFHCVRGLLRGPTEWLSLLRAWWGQGCPWTRCIQPPPAL